MPISMNYFYNKKSKQLKEEPGRRDQGAKPVYISNGQVLDTRVSPHADDVC